MPVDYSRYHNYTNEMKYMALYRRLDPFGC